MIRIYGASDDLVEIEGHPDGDEVGCYDKDVCILIGDTTAGLAVRMSYGESPIPASVGFGEIGFGCWHATVIQVAEDAPVPWPVTITTANRGNGGVGYSVCVNVDAPEGTPLRFAVDK